MRFFVSALLVLLALSSRIAEASPTRAVEQACDRAQENGPATGRRLALVIVNSDYNGDGRISENSGLAESEGYLPDLPNPTNDGTEICSALGGLGFRVTYVENADNITMGDQLNLFGAQVANAPADAIVIVYYAGHAMEVNNVNYLLPVRAQLPRDIDLTRLPALQQDDMIGRRSVSLRDIFLALRPRTGDGLNIVIIDACRNNPWRERGRGRGLSRSAGLAHQDPDDDLNHTLVAYSTASGMTASDGNGTNSPYALALLHWLPRANVPVNDMFNEIGLEMEREGDQRPYTYGPGLPRVCLAGCQSAPIVGPSQPRPPPADAGRASPNETAHTTLAALSAPEWSVGEGRASIPAILQAAPFSSYLALANSGEVRAQAVVGGAYLNGYQVPADINAALPWLTRAASRGDSRAQVGLGGMYFDGTGVQRDYVRAMQWYRRAADQGNARGQYNVGALYSSGQGVERDDLQAFDWYMRAARQGLSLAQVKVGWLYVNGLGVARNYAEGARWYGEAASRGNALAQFNLGLMLFAGPQGVIQDRVRARSLIAAAAANGLQDARRWIDARDAAPPTNR